MRILHCDGCERRIDTKTEVYYGVGELTKNVPKSSGMRMLIRHEDIAQKTQTELVADPMGWVSYEDLHFCAICIQRPIDISLIFQAREAE